MVGGLEDVYNPLPQILLVIVIRPCPLPAAPSCFFRPRSKETAYTSTACCTLSESLAEDENMTTSVAEKSPRV
jgi:hypothetical protein